MPDIFPIVPAASRAPWFLAAVGLVTASVTILLAYLAWSTQHSRVEVGAAQVRLVGDLWGRTIPLAALDLSHARRVDLLQETSLRPAGRTFGTGLPGYAAGWFRLANGEKALTYLTDWRHVVYVPTRDGYALLLSVAEPEAFLARLARSGLVDGGAGGGT